MIDVQAFLRVTYCYITDVTAHLRIFGWWGLRHARIIVRLSARVIVKVIVKVRARPATAISIYWLQGPAFTRVFEALCSRANLQAFAAKTTGSFPSINPMVL
jgi:hypothetical protein